MILLAIMAIYMAYQIFKMSYDDLERNYTTLRRVCQH